MSRATIATALAALLALPLGGAAAAQAGGFASGDLYLYNPAFQGGSSSAGALVRVDPVAGTVSMVVDLVTSSSTSGALAYDPWRDRLIFFGGLVPNHNEVYLCDAAGNLESLGLGVVSGPGLGAFAPRGDGIIYFRGFNAPSVISYFDSANQVQTLMDASGAAPYAFPSSPANIRRLHYDAGTNALFAATSSGVVACTGGLNDAVNLRRLDLSADGTRVLAETCFQYDLKPGTFGEVPVGLSSGPQGDLLLTIDDNSNNTLPRMAQVDAAAANAVPFAWNGHSFAAATNAGCYSQVLGRAVLLDTGNDVLRAFAAGESGSGTVIATGVSSPGGTGETATLVEIGLAQAHFGMTASPSALSVSSGGTQSFSIDLGAAHAGEPYLVLGSLSGWTPGIFADGVNVPLQLDAYLLWTLSSPNSAVLQSTFGLLDAQGGAAAAFVLPPGSPPALIGQVAHHATLAFAFSGTLRAATNAVPVAFLP